MQTSYIALVGSLSLACSVPAFAQGSPWLPEPETGDFSIAYVRQSADDKWTNGPGVTDGTLKGPMPGGELTQETLWFTANYAFRDNIAVDARLGWADSELGSDGDSGMVDSSLGLTLRLADELVGSPIQFRSAWRRHSRRQLRHREHHCRTPVAGRPASTLSAMAAIASRSPLSPARYSRNEWAYRLNSATAIAATAFRPITFYNLSGLVLVNDRLTLALDYQRVNSDGDLDIGDTDFNPDRFPRSGRGNNDGGRPSHHQLDRCDERNGVLRRYSRWAQRVGIQNLRRVDELRFLHVLERVRRGRGSVVVSAPQGAFSDQSYSYSKSPLKAFSCSVNSGVGVFAQVFQDAFLAVAEIFIEPIVDARYQQVAALDRYAARMIDVAACAILQ